ncbi:MAG: MBL fold metallo-hydrolase [Candidatus Caldarchaeum sp.]
MLLQKFAQSTFVIQNLRGFHLLIDPGKYDFEGNTTDAGKFGDVSILIITHKHEDHFHTESVKLIVERCNPTVFTNQEISTILEKEGISSIAVKPGDEFEVNGFNLSFTRTDHVVRGQVVVNFGVVVESEGKRVYHASDTRYIEPTMLGNTKVLNPDVLCVPISNRGVVMGVDDALYFTSEIKPRIVIPIHYDSPKDSQRVRPEHFVQRFGEIKKYLDSLNHTEVVVLERGESITI